MKIKKIGNDYQKWDDFCLESDDCWFWHTTEWMKYSIEYNNCQDSEILSFYLEDGAGVILAICPLIREEDKFTFGGSFCPNPALRNGLSSKLSKNLLNIIFHQIDSLTLENNIKECLMSISTLAKNNLKQFSYNYLMKYNFENISLNTQLIDLDNDTNSLWSNIKKSHRNEIKKGNNQFNLSFLLPSIKNEDLFNDFKNLHFLAAGKKTRTNRSWEFQKKWLEQGNAIIVFANKDDKLIGGIYALLYKNHAYYGISANHPDFEYLPISHSIQWELIKWLKQNRYHFYELGYQHFSDQPFDHPSQKELDISLFKRHFGGFTITHYRGKRLFR